MSKKSNTLLATGVGIAVGALIGVLFAPAKGSETREQIAQKSKDVKDDVLDKKDEIIDALASKKDNITEYLVGLKDSLSDSIEDTKENKKADLLSKIDALEKLIKKV